MPIEIGADIDPVADSVPVSHFPRLSGQRAANRFITPSNALDGFYGISPAPDDPELEFFVAPAAYPSCVAK
jgi:hypothetical protein